MDTLLDRLKKDYPGLAFEPGVTFYWSPHDKKVYYREENQDAGEIAVWSLLHEVGHALLGHNTYQSDFQLLAMEIEAWEKARELAAKHDHEIDANHIQDCLDTYRDWLYQRSTCPTCTSCNLQTDSKTYNCFNCGTTWHVSSSRLCRPYRRKTEVNTWSV